MSNIINNKSTEGFKSLYQKTKEMHILFNSPVAAEPTILSGAGEAINKEFAAMLNSVCNRMKEISASGEGGQVLARSSWMLEELAEFMEAETLEDQVDALTDGQVFNAGTFVEIGVDPEPMTHIVMEANMGKVWPDGKPRFDPQGKWIKPPGWAKNFAPEPRLRDAIFWQKVEAKRCPECGCDRKVLRRVGQAKMKVVLCQDCLAQGKQTDITLAVRKADNAVH